MKKPTQSAFTLIEVTVVVAILGLILAFAVPAVVSALRGSQATGGEAAVKTLNEAAIRARLKDMLGPGTVGSDKVAALDWYLDQNLIQNTKRPDISDINFLYGFWSVPLWNSVEEFNQTAVLSGEALEAAIAARTGYGTFLQLLQANGSNTFQEFMDRTGFTSLEQFAGVTGTSTLNLDYIANTPGAISYIIENFDQFDAASISSIATQNNLTQEQRLGLFEKLKPTSQTTGATGPGLARLLEDITRQPNGYGELDVSGLNFSSLGSPNADYTKTNVSMGQINQLGYIQGTFTGMDLTGLNLTNKYLSADISNTTGVTGAMLNTLQGIGGANLSGLNLTGINLNGKYINQVDFSNTTGLTGSNFNGVSTLYGSKLTGIDLSGFTGTNTVLQYTDFTGTQNFNANIINNANPIINGINLSGQNLTGVNFTGKQLNSGNYTNATGLTPQMIANATSISNLVLTGTGITKSALDAALITAGKDPNTGNFNTNTITF